MEVRIRLKYSNHLKNTMNLTRIVLVLGLPNKSIISLAYFYSELHTNNIKRRLKKKPGVEYRLKLRIVP